MFKIFDKIANADIVLEKDADKAVILAAEDLKKNLLDISSVNKNFRILFGDETKGNIAVKTENHPETPEGYTVEINEDGAVITGTDTLGTIFGIYAFASKVLKIDPMYRITDLFPESREELTAENTKFFSPERKVRFRGWFLNDEDLLTDFKISGGKRNIDYPFYGNVMDVTVLDMIIETALRCEINLMIPSSFVDVDNPDEAVLIEQVVRRGMYVSQHHIEPVGVSHFTADNYLKKRGLENEVVSFVSNRDRMIEIWKHYIKLWAKYGDRVIWQLGLRGKADQAVWQADPSISNDASVRGGIISDAIKTQYDIISKTLGHTDFYSTATLWMEGAELYGKGHISLPEKTVAIFSDIGFTSMFGDDFYTTPRNRDGLYGIYYHVGYWGWGPHLAEGCDLNKMAFSYKEAQKQNSLFYSILNVSNVRPLHFSAAVNAKLLAAPDADIDQLINGALYGIYGENAEQMREIYDEYYKIIPDLGKEEIKAYCSRYDFHYHEYGDLPFPEFPITDGFLRAQFYRLTDRKSVSLDDCRLMNMLKKSITEYEALLAKAKSISGILTVGQREYAEKFIFFEILLMKCFSKWFVNAWYMMNEADGTDEYYNIACEELKTLLEARKILEHGKWQNWHRGDKKINVKDLFLHTKQAYLKKVGETR